MLKKEKLLQLYDTHGTPLYRCIYQFVRNREAAEELVQDCFEKLIAYLMEQEIHEEKIKQFLYAIAQNQCVNYLKRTRRAAVAERPQKLATLIRAGAASSLTGEIDPAGSRVYQLLENGDPVTLSLFIMRRELGMSVEEISRIAGLSACSVRRRMKQVITLIKDELLAEDLFDDAGEQASRRPICRYAKGKLLVQLIERTLREKKKRAMLDHIAGCDQCRSLDRLIRNIVASPERIVPEPGPLVRDRVLSFYDSLPVSNENKVMETIARRRAFTGPGTLAFGAAFLMISAITAIIAWQLSGQAHPARLPIRLVSLQGPARLDDAPPSPGRAVYAGEVVSTGPGSRALLDCEEVMTIELNEKSEVRILESLRYANPRSYAFGFGMKSGSLHATFFEGYGLAYDFITPHARIHAGGTEFTLTVDRLQTRVSVTAGTLAITPTGATGDSHTMAETGYEYRINAGGTVARDKMNSEPGDATNADETGK